MPMPRTYVRAGTPTRRKRQGRRLGRSASSNALWQALRAIRCSEMASRPRVSACAQKGSQQRAGHNAQKPTGFALRLP